MALHLGSVQPPEPGTGPGYDGRPISAKQLGIVLNPGQGVEFSPAHELVATFAGAASTAAESAGTPNATVNLSPALPPNITLRYTDNSAAGTTRSSCGRPGVVAPRADRGRGGEGELHRPSGQRADGYGDRRHRLGQRGCEHEPGRPRLPCQRQQFGVGRCRAGEGRGAADRRRAISNNGGPWWPSTHGPYRTSRTGHGALTRT